MSLFISGDKGNKYISVFQPEVKEKYVKANITTSTKDEREASGYKNMYWKAVFVGQAKQPAEDLKDFDKIQITKAFIENDYNKDLEKLFVKVVILDFEFMEAGRGKQYDEDAIENEEVEGFEGFAQVEDDDIPF